MGGYLQNSDTPNCFSRSQLSQGRNRSFDDDNPSDDPFHATQVLTPPIAFTAAMTILCHVHKSDQHQSQFVFAGITTGVVAGMAMERDLRSTLLKALPWTILLSLLLSIVFHGIQRRARVLKPVGCL